MKTTEIDTYRIKYRILYSLYLFIILFISCIKQEKIPAIKIQMKFDPAYKFLYSYSKVKDRNFYWTTIIENDNNAKSAIENNKALKLFLLNKKDLINSLVSKGINDNEYINDLKFTYKEKKNISNTIKDIIIESKYAFEKVNKDHIEQSGAFNHFLDIKDAVKVHELIVEQMLDGINNIIDTYVAGKDPIYPKLDRVSYDVNSTQYLAWVQQLLSMIEAKSDQYTLFYQPVLDFALGVMALNKRNEAARFIPLYKGENKLVFQYLKTINWDKYPYSMIVVLGNSPDKPFDLPNISITGMRRSDHGVALLKQGIAPIIAFTGANIAPFQSKYHEAIEMKKYVMGKYAIPENQILVEPHARHTTTNIRNIGRLIYRYGIPENKKALVSTSIAHSAYITSEKYANRCIKQMGHIPMKFYKRISDFDVEFTPLPKVLHLNSFDPLDP